MFFKKKNTLTVENEKISVYNVDGEDYISLTDMIRSEEGADHIRNWMRNRNVVEFLGLWETMNNPSFKGVEFDRFRKEAGLNNFNLTPKKWIEATNAKGIISKSGRYGGTYAHKDIAFEFGTWISSSFKLFLIKEYQKSKEIESNKYNREWDVRRIISKANYQIHTDAIKEYIIPTSRKWVKDFEYTEEADMLNMAIFGRTSKEWRKANPEQSKAGYNIREVASINELNVLSTVESLNAEMMREGLDKKTRFNKIQDIAHRQLEALNKQDFMKSLKKTSNDVYIENGSKKEDEIE